MEETYLNIRVSNETKEALEEARAKEVYEISKSLDTFIAHILKEYNKKK